MCELLLSANYLFFLPHQWAFRQRNCCFQRHDISQSCPTHQNCCITSLWLISGKKTSANIWPSINSNTHILRSASTLQSTFGSLRVWRERYKTVWQNNINVTLHSTTQIHFTLLFNLNGLPFHLISGDQNQSKMRFNQERWKKKQIKIRLLVHFFPCLLAKMYTRVEICCYRY